VIAAVYLIASSLAGLTLVHRLFSDLPAMVRLAGGFLAGIVLTAWATFLIAFALSGLTEAAVDIGIAFAIGLNLVIVGVWGRGLRPAQFRLSGIEMLFVGASLAFSFWLMEARLRGDPLLVSFNTWGDTALHVSLARSFSWGFNFPPEYPFYALEPIRYHFGYDFFAGALERGGMSIGWAFNLPGAFGFAAIMALVFSLGRNIFRSPWVGAMAVVLLITNSSLAFLRYFDLYDNDVWEALRHLWDKQESPFHDRYLAVGPYFVEGRIDPISIFWTLNVFLTQTHLIIAMGIVLFVAHAVIGPLREGRPLWTHKALALGVLMGMSFWLNGVLYVAAMVFFIGLFFVFGDRLRSLPYLAAGFIVLMVLGSAVDGAFYVLALVYAFASLVLSGKLRESLPFLVPAGLLALPQVFWLNGLELQTDGGIRQHTAYLVCSSPVASCHETGFDFLTLSHYWDFVEYWWLNLGLALPLMGLAVVLGSKTDRKVMLAIMGIFIFGNFVQLSRDLGGHNHKIFNLWEILMNVFVAYAFVRLGTIVARNVNLGRLSVDERHCNYAARAAMPAVFLFLVLSGIIDFMVIKNDGMIPVFGDKETTIKWIEENTPRDAVFLTVYGDLYTAPALAGRRVFLGYEPWVESAGYEVPPRTEVTRNAYGAESSSGACRLLLEHGIDYLQISAAERNSDRIEVNEEMFQREFVAAGMVEAPDGPVYIYDVARSCDAEAVVSSG
jgi:hypothetical protein